MTLLTRRERNGINKSLVVTSLRPNCASVSYGIRSTFSGTDLVQRTC